jgi:hypothetical protein
MRFPLHTLTSALLITVAPIARAVGQDAYVYYDHHPGPASLDARLSYVGDAGLRTGRPPALTVPSGSQLCIQVVNRNEILYSYAITAKDIPADTIPGLSALIKQLNGALNSVSTRAAAGATGEPRRQSYDPYLTAVADLYKKLLDIQSYQQASDTVADFPHAAGEIARLTREAADTNRAATAALGGLGADTNSAEVRLIRTVHADVWSRIGVIANRFRHALGTLGDPLCTRVATSRLRVTLKIAATTADLGGAPQRPTGDTVLTLVVEPRDDRNVLVEPGTLVSAFTQDKSTIGVRTGVITQAPDHGMGVHAGVFALFRAGTIPWLWVAVGAATGEQLVPDFFIGMAVRGGASLVGGRIFAGVGLALTRVPVGVSQGSVGGALPADVKKVDDIIQREFRPGLGGFLAIRFP